MHKIPTELRFPKPPFRIDRSLVDSPPSDDAVVGYLEQILAWRSAVLRMLGPPGGNPVLDVQGLSERARRTLVLFLANRWPEEASQHAAQSPYNLGSFPVDTCDAKSGPTLGALLEVLRWRAGVVDYLSDIWDVLGEPELDMEECRAIDAFLHPASQEELCGLCLTEFAPDKLHVDEHSCLLIGHVRAKWPDWPFDLGREGQD